MMGTDWLERLQAGECELSRTERDLVSYINNHPEFAVSLTQLKLAEAAGVSKPVVISCFRKLGFDDYRSFQNSVEQFFSTQIDALRASERMQDRVHSVEELIHEAAAVDIRSLQRLERSISAQTLNDLASRCFSARTLYFFGEGTGYYPAHYLAQRLRRYGRQALMVTQDPSHRPDLLHPMGSDDALFLFHYSDNDAWLWPLLDLARKRSVWTLLVSATIHPDYVAGASCFLHVPRGEFQFKNSIAVPMHFANLILLACELIYRNEVKEQLTALESTRGAWNRASGKNIRKQGGKDA